MNRKKHPHGLEPLDCEEEKHPVGVLPQGLLHPLQNRPGVDPLTFRESRLEELPHRRQLERLGIPHRNCSQPRFTHADPSDPLNFAPAAPSET